MSHLKIPVEEYTTPNPITATEATLVSDLLKVMKDKGIRHMPILRGEKVVGIVSERDAKVVNGLNWNEKSLIKAGDIMIPEPVTFSCEATIEEVAFEMSQNKIGSVIVNDENDKLLGIFTVTDALNALIEVARAIED